MKRHTSICYLVENTNTQSVAEQVRAIVHIFNFGDNSTGLKDVANPTARKNLSAFSS